MAKNDPRIVTPIGTLSFPHLLKPDTKFYGLGEYHTKIAFDPNDEAVKAMVATLTKHRDAYVAAQIKENPKLKAFTVQPVFTNELDKEGNETGRILFTAKQKAVVESKAKGTLNFKVVIVDAAKTPWGKQPIFGGSKARLSVDLYGWQFPGSKSIGLGLRLFGVQVIDLVTGAGQDTESAGFDAAEGYTLDTAPAETEDGTDASQF